MNMKVVYCVQQIGFIAIRGRLASKGIIASTVTYLVFYRSVFIFL